MNDIISMDRMLILCYLPLSYLCKQIMSNFILIHLNTYFNCKIQEVENNFKEHMKNKIALS
jgi:long-subunit acyl-CoA synthetase (AMP-forming)